MRKTWDPTVPAVLVATCLVVGTVLATGGMGLDEWRAKLEPAHGSVRLDLCLSAGNGRLRHVQSVDPAELEGLDAAALEQAGAALRFTWKRDAGTFVLEGKGGRRPGGKVAFVPDPGFADGWRGLGFALDEGDVLGLALSGVRLADAGRLHALGYRDVGAHEVIRLGDRSTLDWVEGIQAIGYRPDLEDLFRLLAHGVTAEEARAFSDTGLRLAVDDLVRLHAHAVAPSYVAGLRGCGLSELESDEIIRLHQHGIEPDYVCSVTASGVPGASIDAIVRLHAHGVSADFVRALVEAGPGQHGVDAVILLHDHGASAEWIRGMAAVGQGGLAPSELVRLHAHGVSPDVVRSPALR